MPFNNSKITSFACAGDSLKGFDAIAAQYASATEIIFATSVILS